MRVCSAGLVASSSLARPYQPPAMTIDRGVCGIDRAIAPPPHRCGGSGSTRAAPRAVHLADRYGLRWPSTCNDHQGSSPMSSQLVLDGPNRWRRDGSAPGKGQRPDGAGRVDCPRLSDRASPAQCRLHRSPQCCTEGAPGGAGDAGIAGLSVITPIHGAHAPLSHPSHRPFHPAFLHPCHARHRTHPTRSSGRTSAT